MTVVYAITLSLLALAVLAATVRLLRGPGVLDRIVAVDAIVVLLISGAAVGVATGQVEAVNLLLVVALLGFVGSVTAAHLVEDRDRLS